ncbi:MAG TPA: PEP-CTERM sorting domain-containing protein, partial [Phycisphaerae bacterium]|nr:PEP-CTERM sorting domain-containing protein [Phycisphaerae bacterium]
RMTRSARPQHLWLARAATGTPAIAFLLLNCLAIPASAVTVGLDYLLSDPAHYLDSGDKRFSNFTVTALPGTINTADIEVEAIQQGSDYGFRMAGTLGGPIISAPAGGFADFVLTFNVQTLDPQQLIQGVGLSIEAAAPPGGWAEVVERVWDLNQSVLLGTLAVDTINTTDQLQLPQPYAQLHIDKDFLVIGTVSDGASISSMVQVFPQTPEPATLALLGCGAVLLVRRRRLSTLVPALAGLTFVTAIALSPATADAAVLKDLIDTNGSITFGNLTFSDFGWSIDTVTSQGNYVADPARIDVSGRTLNGMDGLRFSGGMAAIATVNPDSQLHARITYKVTATPPFLLHDVELGFNGRTTLDGSAVVLEEVRDASDALLGSAFVQALSPLTASAILSADVQSAWITKQIDLWGGQSGTSTISIIDQAFSVIPEPSTVAAIGLGTFILLQIRRRA